MVDPLPRGGTPVPDPAAHGPMRAIRIGDQRSVWLVQLTGGVGRQEAPGADHVVGAQLYVELAAGGVEGRRQRVAAQRGQHGGVGAVAVVHLKRGT